MSARSIVACTALAIVLAGCAAGTNPEVEEAAAEEAARAAITRRSAAFADAFRSGDVATLMATVTDDIIIGGSFGRSEGRAGAEEFWGGFFESGRVAALNLQLDPLLVDDDLAIESGRYEETLVMGDAAPMAVSGNYVMVWQRGTDGEWRIRRFIAADLVTAE